jgi:hypothetical protein
MKIGDIISEYDLPQLEKFVNEREVSRKKRLARAFMV